MPNSDVIEFECPRCLEKIRVDHGKAGTRIECPACEGTLLVPTKSQAQDLFNDIFDSDDTSQEISKRESEKQESPKAAQPASDHQDDPVSEPIDDVDDLVAGLEVIGDAPIPLDDVADPFEVDHDAPIRIDGLEELYNHDDVYGVKCKVCDTRIHVRTEQVDSHVECPECFSKVKVTAPTKKPRASQKWLKDGRGEDIKRETAGKEKANAGQGDELQLSPPIEVPETGYAQGEPIDDISSVDEIVPEEDLLVAKPHDPADGLVLENGPDPFSLEDVAPVESADGSATPAALPRSPKLKRTEKKKAVVSDGAETKKTKKPKLNTRPKSRREVYEESQRRIKAGAAQPAFEVELGDTKRTESSYPEFSFNRIGDLLTDAFKMISSPGVIWRTMIALVLLAFGTIAVQVAYYTPPIDPNVRVESTGNPGGDFWESLKVSAKASIIGGVPYFFGLLALWHTCSYLFREAALGQRRVQGWYKGGTNEILGTTLLFAFAFFLAGLPALIYPPFVMPLRMFFAPLLLLGAWHNQSPFNVVSVDAFKKVAKQKEQWTTFYAVMAGLAFFALIAGFMFKVRDIQDINPVIAGFLGLCALLVLVVISLVFAAIAGWHCGRVVEALENSKKA